MLSVLVSQCESMTDFKFTGIFSEFSFAVKVVRY